MSFALEAIVSLLGFDTFIITEKWHYQKKNIQKPYFYEDDYKHRTRISHSDFRAFGWSISMPDISQSNSLQERFLTSDCFLGHWYPP
jgi:hypothetical protein